MTKDAQTKPKKAPTAKKQRLTEQILTLRANPSIKSNRQIAQILDINEGTVCRRLKEVEPQLAIAQAKLKEYDAQFSASGTGMTIAARAERYKELAKQSNSPAVALQTLIRIDDLTGITTEKDRLRAINLGDGAQPQGPMFLMAPGSTVNFGHASEPTPTISSSKVDDDTQDVV